MGNKISILGFGGSLREGSYTRAMLNAAKYLVPQDAEIEIFDIKDIPVFNEDLLPDPPQAVKSFREKIKGADAILVSTPEYNYSVPGYLKNAIDWVSRPYSDNAFDDKPVAIMSGGGMLGGSRAQYHLRQVFVFLNAHLLNKPEVIVPFMQQKIGEDGTVADEHTREKIGELLVALVAWTRRIGRG